MKKFLLPTLVAALMMSACSDKFDSSYDEANRYFIYSNTIPYYFYDSTGNAMVQFDNQATYPISYVELVPEVTVTSSKSNNRTLSNYDELSKTLLAKFSGIATTKAATTAHISDILSTILFRIRKIQSMLNTSTTL